jgi:hypothetical protein
MICWPGHSQVCFFRLIWIAFVLASQGKVRIFEPDYLDSLPNIPSLFPTEISYTRYLYMIVTL